VITVTKEKNKKQKKNFAKQSLKLCPELMIVVKIIMCFYPILKIFIFFLNVRNTIFFIALLIKSLTVSYILVYKYVKYFNKLHIFLTMLKNKNKNRGDNLYFRTKFMLNNEY
jgi:hypothetical protein